MKISKTLTAALIACVALSATVTTASAADGLFGRSIYVVVCHGDANGDGYLDMADVNTMLGILFGGDKAFTSKRSLDHNGDGRFDLADVDSALRDLERLGERRAEPRVEVVIVGDVNDDRRVDIADLFALATWISGGKHYGAPPEAADMNQDGRVDITDLSILAESLGG